MIFGQFFMCLPHDKMMKLFAANLQPIWIKLMKRKLGLLTYIFHYWHICRASARPPAFLSTMPCIPSSLEGMWSHKAPNGYRLLNGVNDLGQSRDSSCGFGLSQSEAFPPLSPGYSDVARECAVILPIEGECVHALGALGSWRLVSALETECSVVDRKVGLSLKDLAAASKVRMPFTPYYLLSLYRSI